MDMQLVIWFLMIVIAGSIYPYQCFPTLWGKYIIPLIYLQWGFYIALSIFSLTPLFKKIARKEKLKPLKNGY